MTKWLLISSIIIFFLNVLLTTSRNQDPPLFLWGYFSVELTFQNFQIWRLFTFQFLHLDVGSMLLGMLGLFFFGPEVERWLGSRPYAFFFILCGVVGAVLLSILSLSGIIGWAAPLFGPEAGTLGILAIFYFIAPDAIVRLMFIFPVKMRTLALLFCVFELISIFSHGLGGSIGHLGGVFLGILIMKNPTARNWLDSLSAIGANRGGKSKGKSRDAKIIREKKRSRKKERSPLEVTEEVNRILDKISEQGIQSLTAKERETLDRSRKN